MVDKGTESNSKAYTAVFDSKGNKLWHSDKNGEQVYSPWFICEIRRITSDLGREIDISDIKKRLRNGDTMHSIASHYNVSGTFVLSIRRRSMTDADYHSKRRQNIGHDN